jgi:hypothetical protein
LQANYTQEWEQLKTVSQQIDLSRRELTEGHIARTALIVNNPNLDDTERQRRLQMEAQLRLMEEARIAELERRRREAEENLRLLNQVTSAQRTMCQAAQAVNESERRLRNANGRQSGSSDGLYAGLDDDLTKWLDQKMQQDHWGLVSGAQQVVSTQLQTTEQPESTDTERQPASQESQATADSRATAGGIPARRQVMEILLKDRATQLTSTRRVEVDGAQPATLLNEGRTGARSTAFSPIQFVAMMEPDAISGLRFGAPLVGTPDLLGQDSRNAYRPSLFPGERVGLTQA